LGWKRVAEALYAASRDDRGVLPAALACRHLLASYQRILLEYRGKFSVSLGQSDLDAIEDRIVTLGATIADGRLKDIWIRAGGDVTRLGLHTYSRDRWRDAVRAGVMVHFRADFRLSLSRFLKIIRTTMSSRTSTRSWRTPH
jgi:hypothetical protein